jgi:HAE1 family hydrophobic/amphiphilic exporter-1
MLSSLSIKRPVAAAMLTVMVAVVGLVSLIRMPQDLLPKIELPVGIVAITYSNASPEEVENMVTKPVEQALAGLENLDMMQSISMQGISIIMIQFKMDTDMAFAALDMREAIGPVSAYLPDEAGDPMVLKLNMNSLPILQVYVYGDMPLARLHQEVEDNIVTYSGWASST